MSGKKFIFTSLLEDIQLHNLHEINWHTVINYLIFLLCKMWDYQADEDSSHCFLRCDTR